MILKLVMSLFNFVANIILGILKFPIFPPEVGQAVAVVFEWINAGLGIFNFFCPLNAIAPAIAIFIAIYAIQKIYHFAMWIMTKIPFFGVSK